jgi:hypothetical protein
LPDHLGNNDNALHEENSVPGFHGRIRLIAVPFDLIATNMELENLSLTGVDNFGGVQRILAVYRDPASWAQISRLSVRDVEYRYELSAIDVGAHRATG